MFSWLLVWSLLKGANAAAPLQQTQFILQFPLSSPEAWACAPRVRQSKPSIYIHLRLCLRTINCPKADKECCSFLSSASKNLQLSFVMPLPKFSNGNWRTQYLSSSAALQCDISSFWGTLCSFEQVINCHIKKFAIQNVHPLFSSIPTFLAVLNFGVGAHSPLARQNLQTFTFSKKSFPPTVFAHLPGVFILSEFADKQSSDL